MRMIRFYIINKATRKAVFTHYSESECKKYLKSMADSENYCIGYKWLSL